MTDPIVTISSIHCRTGIAEKGECLLIGIRINEQFMGWSDCVELSESAINNSVIDYDNASAIKTMREIVAPMLCKRPFPTLQTLSAQLDELIEPITIVETVPVETPSSTVSRRNILSGNFETHAKIVEPDIIKTEAERPLPAPLRYGISCAYLTAVSKLRNQPIAQIISEMYGLDVAQSPIPIHITVNDKNIATAQPILTEHIASLGYVVNRDNAEAILGSGGQKLHQLARQLSNWIPTLAQDYHPTIHLDLQGAFGDLFDHNVGKMLGALYGLDYVAKPYHVRIENLLQSNDDTIANLQRLKSYFVTRKMSLTLMTGASLATMQQLVNADAVHGVHVRLAQLGGLHKTIAFILDCKERGVTVMVSSGNDGLALCGVETAVQIAIATGANLVAGPPTPLFNEMQQMIP